MMKRPVLLLVPTALIFSIVNGCDVNPFSPPDKPIPATDTSSSSSGSGGSSSSSSSSGTAGTGGLGGAGGSGGASSSSSSSSGMAGAGGGCMCTDDNNVCTDDVAGACPNGDPAACHTVKFAAACPAGRCNDMAECVDCLTCTDAACVDRCNGVACTAAGDCKSTHCDQSTCCNASCAGPCRACNRSGVEGTCTRLPLGSQVPGCNSGTVCGSDGSCITQTKAALGALCNVSGDCQSGLCHAQSCHSNVGEPCVEDLECGTNLCDPTTKTCKSCTGANAGVCPAGSACVTQTGVCKVGLGQPAENDGECLMGTAIQYLCALPVGAACQAHNECIGRNCANGVCSQQCANAGQCLSGGPCSPNGVCGMAKGTPCVLNEHCTSGICGGFPRRCQ